MRAYVPRALLSAAVALVATGCAAGAGPATGASPEGGSDRYRVLIPALEVAGGAGGNVGEAIARDLRSYIADMPTHISVPAREMTGAMREYRLTELDMITARQLAGQIRAQVVTWGTVQPGGEGLVADLRVIDVASGDEFAIEGATGANPRQVAQAIHGQFEQMMDGIRRAAFCQDYLASQQYDLALQNCEQALAIVPTSSVALYGKATALLNMDRDEEALALYQQLLANDPTHQDALLGAGLAASRLARSQDALAFYRRYMELNPGDPRIRLTVAGQIAETGDHESAYRVLEPAIAENVEDIEFQLYAARLATAAGMQVRERESPEAARPLFDTALRGYELVLAQGDTLVDADLYRQIIAVYQAVDRAEEGLRIGQQATERFPTDAGLWAAQGDALRTARRHAEAVRAYNRVIELNPEHPEIYIRRALAHREAGNRQAAEADLTRAAQTNRPQVAQVFLAMGTDALRASQFAEATRLLEESARFAEGQARNQALYWQSVALFRQGDAIARANAQTGSAARAREALGFFERALAQARASGVPQAGEIINASEQYIANQRAIIDAARGR
jgi:tetratricopeptide (TPR) repeat protein